MNEQKDKTADRQEGGSSFSGLKSIIPLVFGQGTNALGIVRSLAYSGLTPVSISTRKSVVSYTRYAQSVLCPDPLFYPMKFRAFMAALSKFLSSRNKIGVIFVTDDTFLEHISQPQVRGHQGFLFPSSDYEVLTCTLNKAKLYETASKIGLSLPKTLVSTTFTELKKASLSLSYPCIMKASLKNGLARQAGLLRPRIFKTREALMEFMFRLNEIDFSRNPIILQEEVQGSVERLYTFTCYSDCNGDVIAYSTGRKIRQFPIDTGVISSGQLEPNEDLTNLGIKLIKAIRLHGISNTEFKLDPSDNTFKLIEVNPRPGVWNLSAYGAGVNLPYLACLDALGLQYKGKTHTSDVRAKWVHLISDWASFSKQSAGFQKLNPLVWLRTVNGKRIWAACSWDDPLPIIYDILYAVGMLSRSLSAAKHSNK